MPVAPDRAHVRGVSNAESGLAPVVVVCGPTAAGKTDIAMALADWFDVELISADSVQVYRGMDVGAAKPDRQTLARYPHALIDIRDPEQGYSAAEFARDAEACIRQAHRHGRLPVVVGGTALYLRALRHGLDRLPDADPTLRARIERDAGERGWPALHAELARLDPASAARIRSNDQQRIQRALEICLRSGRPASELMGGPGPDRLRRALSLVIAPADRGQLHRRIDRRWERILDAGLLGEVQRLLARSGVSAATPALRAVGYRQAVECLAGNYSREELARKGAAATRQLAKRQLTAFRQWRGGFWYDPLNRGAIDRIISRAGKYIVSARGGL